MCSPSCDASWTSARTAVTERWFTTIPTTVVVYDPIAEDEARKLIQGVEFARSASDCVAGADAVVLVTEWKEYRELDPVHVGSLVRSRVILETLDLLHQQLEAAMTPN